MSRLEHARRPAVEVGDFLEPGAASVRPAVPAFTSLTAAMLFAAISIPVIEKAAL